MEVPFNASWGWGGGFIKFVVLLKIVLTKEISIALTEKKQSKATKNGKVLHVPGILLAFMVLAAMGHCNKNDTLRSFKKARLVYNLCT